MPTISSVRAVPDARLARLSGLTGRSRERIAPPPNLRKERSSDRELRKEFQDGDPRWEPGEKRTGPPPKGRAGLAVVLTA
jgi:hypothetical protein